MYPTQSLFNNSFHLKAISFHFCGYFTGGLPPRLLLAVCVYVLPFICFNKHDKNIYIGLNNDDNCFESPRGNRTCGTLFRKRRKKKKLYFGEDV